MRTWYEYKEHVKAIYPEMAKEIEKVEALATSIGLNFDGRESKEKE